jgi:DNA-directed RNA polymerase specialized sigma24 family protein
MVDESLMQMLGAWSKFDPEKSQNPFSYFTQVMKNAANQILRREKANREAVSEQRVLVDDLMEEAAPGSRSRHRWHGNDF